MCCQHKKLRSIALKTLIQSIKSFQVLFSRTYNSCRVPALRINVQFDILD